MAIKCGTNQNDMAFMAITIIQVTTWVGLLFTTTECEKFQGTLPDADVLMKFIETYLKPLGKLAQSSPYFRGHNDQRRKEIFHKIDSKIDSLKPYLQDNDTNDDADTTIIEFHPRASDDTGPDRSNVTFKLYKFKKIRDIIKVNLDKEMVSEKTKKIVIKTLDTLISHLSKSRCTQSNGGDSVITFRNRYSKNMNITMNYWKNITNMYFDNLNDRKFNDSESLPAKVEELNDFFINIMNDTVHYNKKQKLKCELVEVARRDTKEDSLNSCAHYKICSKELKNFMKDFYDSTKSTVDTTFKNYGAMYERDVNTEDVKEKETIEKVIIKLRQTFEERIDKIIEKYVTKFKLDEKKDRDINIARIDTFVKEITSNILKKVKHYIENNMNDMAPLKTRTVLLVQDDILANLEHDLVSLKNDYVGKNCRYFHTCNGIAKNKGKRRSNDDFFVNLKVSVDDDFKDILNSDSVLPFLKPNFKSWNGERKLTNYDKYKTARVTRTTTAKTKATEIAKTTKTSAFEELVSSTQNNLIGNAFKGLTNRSLEIRLKIV